MSSEQSQPALNIYIVLDNELQRMHQLMHLYMQLPTSNYQQQSSYSSNTTNTHLLPPIFTRIKELQDVMLDIARDHDKEIQAKVAELAMTTKE